MLFKRKQQKKTTAWDYKFSRITEPKWLCICLENGDLIRGLFGYNSFASSEKYNRDIYIEKVYLANEKGNWVLDERTDGAWISLKDVRWVSFYTYREED